MPEELATAAAWASVSAAMGGEPVEASRSDRLLKGGRKSLELQSARLKGQVDGWRAAYLVKDRVVRGNGREVGTAGRMRRRQGGSARDMD